MHPYHLATEHTWQSVRNGRRLNWAHQPEVFRRYPATYPALALKSFPWLEEFLHLCGGLTARKRYPGMEYFLRVNPSAGALYPCEIYIQTRRVEGLADGIYHFEPRAMCLRRLYLLDGDGLEAGLADQRPLEGLILLISACAYRSSWKYGDRALRYCLLDSGHVLGCIEAAAAVCDQPFSLVCSLDRARLAGCFGFSADDLVMAAALCGLRREGRVQDLKMALPGLEKPEPCNPVIEQAYRDLAGNSRPLSDKPLRPCSPVNCEELYSVSSQRLRQAIERRRSIRSFLGGSLDVEQYRAVMDPLAKPWPADRDPELTLFPVLHRVEGMAGGLYRGNTLQRRGDFRQQCGYLCLEQDLGADGAVTVFLVSEDRNYLAFMLKAGFLGQRLYLAAQLQGLGCSGIGAFYDAEVRDFLGCQGMISYSLAFGL